MAIELSDLNDIRIFTVIAQEATLTAAAARLHLPTSTVSRALTRLEKSMDIQLVQRNMRGLVLTDFGRDYLVSCRKALRILREGGESLAARREKPNGIIKVGCPINMVRAIFAHVLPEFLTRYPELRVELEPYTSGWDQEPREDVDLYFKIRAPKDSNRRVRPYPGVKRGIFASRRYLEAHRIPQEPDDLSSHTCIGIGTWKLSCENQYVSPNIAFRVIGGDPMLHLELVLRDFGIALLPLYMAQWPQTSGQLVRILPEWNPEPIILCALFSGPSRLTPKVQVLLDFLGEYLGTDKDPRLYGMDSAGIFTEPLLTVTSGS